MLRKAFEGARDGEVSIPKAGRTKRANSVDLQALHARMLASHAATRTGRVRPSVARNSCRRSRHGSGKSRRWNPNRGTRRRCVNTRRRASANQTALCGRASRESRANPNAAPRASSGISVFFLERRVGRGCEVGIAGRGRGNPGGRHHRVDRQHHDRADIAAQHRTAPSDAHPGDKVSVGWRDSSGTAHTATVTLIADPPT